jgi:hypothetical protein
VECRVVADLTPRALESFQGAPARPATVPGNSAATREKLAGVQTIHRSLEAAQFCPFTPYLIGLQFFSRFSTRPIRYSC